MIKEEIKKLISEKNACIGVVGLGYVGLPLIVEFSLAGFPSIGFEVDGQKAESINQGRSHIVDVPSENIQKCLETGKFRATTDFSELASCDAVIICVPTPLRKTKDPDMSYILAAGDEIRKYMRRGQLIILESTTYPGTTREILLPKLEENHELTVGENFFLAFSPERVDPGRQDWTTLNTPKVIGGITLDCTHVATEWYSQALQTVVPVSSAEVAEMAKLLENTFRMINIGLVNEMALMCDRLGVDVWEVIDAAATKPFGFMKFTPGPGLGGHCIPIDPLYLSWKLRALNYTARFIELASEINTGMPRYVVGKIQDVLNDNSLPIKGSRIMVLGVAYKPDIDDLRESPALDVIGLLKQKGARVSYHDPYIPHLDHEGWRLESAPDMLTAAREADCVVIVTDHSSYDYPAIQDAAKLIVDTRNALGSAGRADPKVFRI